MLVYVFIFNKLYKNQIIYVPICTCLKQKSCQNINMYTDYSFYTYIPSIIYEDCDMKVKKIIYHKYTLFRFRMILKYTINISELYILHLADM